MKAINPSETGPASHEVSATPAPTVHVFYSDVVNEGDFVNTDGTFKPDQTITREEMVVMLFLSYSRSTTHHGE